MAAKKKATKTAPKKAPAKKAPAQKPLVAMKLLETLPPIDSRRRRVYLAAFSEEQCAAWGAQTKAGTVLDEADKFVAEIAPTVKKGAVSAYSAFRFAWLCGLVTELGDAVAADSTREDLFEARSERNALFTRADNARRKLVNGLRAAAHGNADFEKEVSARNETARSPHVLESTLAGLLQLATTLRRTDDGELVADDVGLTAEFLSSVSALSDALREANLRTFGERSGNDSIATNRIEGRVLREMNFAIGQFKFAKEEGAAVSLPRPGSSLTSVKSASASAPASNEQPTG